MVQFWNICFLFELEYLWLNIFIRSDYRNIKSAVDLNDFSPFIFRWNIVQNFNSFNRLRNIWFLVFNRNNYFRSSLNWDKSRILLIRNWFFLVLWNRFLNWFCFLTFWDNDFFFSNWICFLFIGLRWNIKSFYGYSFLFFYYRTFFL